MRTMRTLLALLLLAAPVAGQDTIRTRTPVVVVPVADTVVRTEVDTVLRLEVDTVFVSGGEATVVCLQRESRWFRWSDWEAVECPDDIPVDLPGEDPPTDEPDEPQEPDEPSDDPPSGPVEPTDPRGAIMVEDWGYSSVAQMFAGPVEDATTGGGAVELINVSGQPFSRAMRARFDANQGSEPQVGVGLRIPPGHREVWIEFYARFSANWTTNGPGSGNPDFKFLFLFDRNPDGSRRWEHNMGVFGSNIGVYIAGDGTNHGGGSRFFDGQWHRYRYHASMDGPAWEVWIDETRYASGTTVPASRFNGLDFRHIGLSRNLNRGTDRTMSVDFGPVRVYTSDPGW